MECLLRKKYSQMNEYKDWSKVSNFLSCGIYIANSEINCIFVI